MYNSLVSLFSSQSLPNIVQSISSFLTNHPKSGHELADLLPKLQRITGAGASNYTREVPLDPSNITEDQLLLALDPAAGDAHSWDIGRMAWSEDYKALVAQLPVGEQGARLVPAGMVD